MPERDSLEVSKPLTVLGLHELIQSLADSTPVLVHVGWSWPILETDINEDGLILFADTPEGVSFVNSDGLDSMQKSSTATARRLMLAEALLRRWLTPEKDGDSPIYGETERFLFSA